RDRFDLLLADSCLLLKSIKSSSHRDIRIRFCHFHEMMINLALCSLENYNVISDFTRKCPPTILPLPYPSMLCEKPLTSKFQFFFRVVSRQITWRAFN